MYNASFPDIGEPDEFLQQSSSALGDCYLNLNSSVAMMRFDLSS